MEVYNNLIDVIRLGFSFKLLRLGKILLKGSFAVYDYAEAKFKAYFARSTKAILFSRGACGALNLQGGEKFFKSEL